MPADIIDNGKLTAMLERLHHLINKASVEDRTALNEAIIEYCDSIREEPLDDSDMDERELKGERLGSLILYELETATLCYDEDLD